MKLNHYKVSFIILLFILLTNTVLHSIDINFNNLSFDEILPILREKHSGEIITTTKIKTKISIRTKNISMNSLMEKIAKQCDVILSKKGDSYIFGNVITGSVLLNVKFTENKKHLFSMHKLVKVGEDMEFSKDSIEIKIIPELISR